MAIKAVSSVNASHASPARTGGARGDRQAPRAGGEGTGAPAPGCGSLPVKRGSLYRLEEVPEEGVLESGYYVLGGDEGPAALVYLAKPTDVGAAWEEMVEHEDNFDPGAGEFDLRSYRLTFDRVVLQWIGVAPRQELEVLE